MHTKYRRVIEHSVTLCIQQLSVLLFSTSLHACTVAHTIIIRVSGITYQSTAYESVIYTHPLSSSSLSHSVLFVYKLIDIKDARVYIHQSTPRIYRYSYFSRGGGVYYPLYTRSLLYICIVISFSLYLFFHSPKKPLSVRCRRRRRQFSAR